MLILQNTHYQFSINPQRSTWSLYGPSLEKSSLEDVQMGVSYRSGGKIIYSLQSGLPLLGGGVQEVDSVHGSMKVLSLKSSADPNGVRLTVSFALPSGFPLALWKLQIDNRSSQPVDIERIVMLKAGANALPKITPSAVLLGTRPPRKSAPGSIRAHANPGELAFYTNGWQSWSYAGMLGSADRYPRTHFGFLRLPVENGAGTALPKRRGHFASDMFGILVDRKHRTGILAGFLSQKKQFGSLEVILDRLSPVMTMWANGDGALVNPGGSMETDWACVQYIELDQVDPFGAYLDAVGRENAIIDFNPSQGKLYTGWCSWYHFYTKAVPADIQRNLNAAADLRERIPLDLIQIDDGFEAKVGDWYSFKEQFHNGVAPIAKEIHEEGFTPGLWLAPFIADPSSKFVREHPNWILKGDWRFPANTGLVWEGFGRALDLTVPEACDYAANVCRTAVLEWGFPYLKLDFLYAAALPGRFHDPTKTRAQALRMGLQAIRDAVGPSTYLVGCGCPLGPAVGLVDAMRVSADVEQRWEPSHFNLSLPFKGEPGVPGAKNSMRNSMTRAPFHRRWWVNDPDCLLLRDSTHLSEAEVKTMAAVISLASGSLIVSDDLSQVPQERLDLLQALLPPIDKSAALPDFFDVSIPSHIKLDLNGSVGSWSVLSLVNWKDKAVDLRLRLADFGLDSTKAYIFRSFWDNSIYSLAEETVFSGVPAHGSIVGAVRLNIPDEAQYMGSSFHISQGMEVNTWEPRDEGLLMRLTRPGKQKGIVDIKLPRIPAFARLNGNLISWEELMAGFYRFKLDIERETIVEIAYR